MSSNNDYLVIDKAGKIASSEAVLTHLRKAALKFEGELTLMGPIKGNRGSEMAAEWSYRSFVTAMSAALRRGGVKGVLTTDVAEIYSSMSNTASHISGSWLQEHRKFHESVMGANMKGVLKAGRKNINGMEIVNLRGVTYTGKRQQNAAKRKASNALSTEKVSREKVGKTRGVETATVAQNEKEEVKETPIKGNENELKETSGEAQVPVVLNEEVDLGQTGKETEDVSFSDLSDNEDSFGGSADEESSGVNPDFYKHRIEAARRTEERRAREARIRRHVRDNGPVIVSTLTTADIGITDGAPEEIVRNVQPFTRIDHSIINAERSETKDELNPMGSDDEDSQEDDKAYFDRMIEGMEGNEEPQYDVVTNWTINGTKMDLSIEENIADAIVGEYKGEESVIDLNDFDLGRLSLVKAGTYMVYDSVTFIVGKESTNREFLESLIKGCKGLTFEAIASMILTAKMDFPLSGSANFLIYISIFESIFNLIGGLPKVDAFLYNEKTDSLGVVSSVHLRFRSYDWYSKVLGNSALPKLQKGVKPINTWMVKAVDKVSFSKDGQSVAIKQIEEEKEDESRQLTEAEDSQVSHAVSKTAMESDILTKVFNLVTSSSPQNVIEKKLKYLAMVVGPQVIIILSYFGKTFGTNKTVSSLLKRVLNSLYIEVPRTFAKDPRASVNSVGRALRTKNAEQVMLAWSKMERSRITIGELLDATSKADVLKGSGPIGEKRTPTISAMGHLFTVACVISVMRGQNTYYMGEDGISGTPEAVKSFFAMNGIGQLGKLVETGSKQKNMSYSKESKIKAESRAFDYKPVFLEQKLAYFAINLVSNVVGLSVFNCCDEARYDAMISTKVKVGSDKRNSRKEAYKIARSVGVEGNQTKTLNFIVRCLERLEVRIESRDKYGIISAYCEEMMKRTGAPNGNYHSLVAFFKSSKNFVKLEDFTKDALGISGAEMVDLRDCHKQLAEKEVVNLENKAQFWDGLPFTSIALRQKVRAVSATFVGTDTPGVEESTQ